MLEFGYPFLVILVAGGLQGLTGFGSGLVGAGLLAVVWPMQQVVGVGSAFSILIVVYLTWHLRRHVQWPELVPMIAGGLAGIPLGIWGLENLDSESLKVVLGLVLIAYVAWSLLGEHEPIFERISRNWALVPGFIGGILGGALNTGGPPPVIWAAERGWRRDVFRANLQGYFLPGAVFTTSLLAIRGIINAETLAWNLRLLPALVIGVLAGNAASGKVAEGPFRKLVLVLLLAIGLFLARSLVF